MIGHLLYIKVIVITQSDIRKRLQTGPSQLATQKVLLKVSKWLQNHTVQTPVLIVEK